MREACGDVDVVSDARALVDGCGDADAEFDARALGDGCGDADAEFDTRALGDDRLLAEGDIEIEALGVTRALVVAFAVPQADAVSLADMEAEGVVDTVKVARGEFVNVRVEMRLRDGSGEAEIEVFDVYDFNGLADSVSDAEPLALGEAVEDSVVVVEKTADAEGVNVTATVTEPCADTVEDLVSIGDSVANAVTDGSKIVRVGVNVFIAEGNEVSDAPSVEVERIVAEPVGFSVCDEASVFVGGTVFDAKDELVSLALSDEEGSDELVTLGEKVTK